MSSPKILLDREILPHHLPLLAVEKTGALEVVEPETPFPSLTPLYEGQVQFALTHPAALVKDFLAGNSIVGIACYLKSRGGFLCRSNSVAQPKNLSEELKIDGRNLGDRLTNTLLNKLRRHEKLETLNFSIDTLHSKTVESLKNLKQGKLDVFGPATIMPEGLLLQSRNWEGDFIFFDNYNLPEIGQLILVANRQYSDSNPNQSRDFVHSVHKKMGLLQNDHERARELYESGVGEENSEILLNSSLSSLCSDLSQDHQLYENWADIIASATDSENYVNLDRLLDERFLPMDALGYPMDM